MNPKNMLAHPLVYSAYQKVIGASAATRWMLRDHWQIKAGSRVLDFGCGPCSTLCHLPDSTEYLGVDIDPSYVEYARHVCRSYSGASFRCESIFDIERDPAIGRFDVILAIGVFHHMDDAEAMRVLYVLAKLCRGPGSRLLCAEPCLLAHQDRCSRFMIEHDRGAFPRTERAWGDLFSSAFSRVDGRIATGLYRIPFVSILSECSHAKL